MAQVLGEGNAEVRRVMLERIGFDRFMQQAGAEMLDGDRDPGGPRRLLSVKLPGDEDLVCLSVRCPSTGRQYALRVPPTMPHLSAGGGLDGGLRRCRRLLPAHRDLTASSASSAS